jgi:hypothetical protein
VTYSDESVTRLEMGTKPGFRRTKGESLACEISWDNG